jgi:glycerate-2-kinase
VTDRAERRALALALYEAAVAAADPAQVVLEGLAAHAATLEPLAARPHWIIAVGKAAPAMAGAARAWCAGEGRHLAGGLVVGSDAGGGTDGIVESRIDDVTREETWRAATRVDATAAGAPLEHLAGDHPVPGPRSLVAAAALERLTHRIAPDDIVLVLISGGTSALIGAPIDGIRAVDLATLHTLLLGAGVPIGRINAVRKRFSRWGGGRLAVALRHARVVPILLADVPNEDPAMIGSGPVSPDPLTARQVERVLREAGIATRLPLSIASTLGAMRADPARETPKPDDPAFIAVTEPIVRGNALALAGAAAVARQRGWHVITEPTPLHGDAAAAGHVVAHRARRAMPGTVLLWGGETAVRLPDPHGVGGRCQQLALAAAEEFAESSVPVTVLAAGTDGRDGPTDAAGAVVDEGTRITPTALRDALRRCDAHPVLAAAGALLPARATGTNVMDLVVAIRS